MTMGSLVMLKVAGDSSFSRTLAESITSSDPGVRAIAARLVNVGRLTQLRGGIIEALARESHDLVAAEQVYALLMLGMDDGAAAADAYLDRAAFPAQNAYSLALARQSADRLIEKLPHLVKSAGSRAPELAAAVMMAAHQHPARRGDLIRAWLRHGPTDGWKAALDTMHLPPVDGHADVSVLREVLLSGDEPRRQSTVWAIVAWISERRTVPHVLLDAALPSAGQPSGELTWEGFGREIVARHYRNLRAVNRAAFLSSTSTVHRDDALVLRNVEALSRAERSAVQKALGNPDAWKLGRATSAPHEQDVLPALRTPENVWPGFFRSVLDTAGCAVGSEATYGAVRLTYGEDGRPVAAGLDQRQLSQGCGLVLAALVEVALADVDRPVTAEAFQWLVLPFSPQFIACVDRESAADIPRPINGDAAPRVRRSVKPAYNASAMERRIEGTAIVTVVIDSSGCVGSAAVTRSLESSLDFQALRAAAHWTFSPATREGKPIAIRAEIALTFKIHP